MGGGIAEMDRHSLRYAPDRLELAEGLNRPGVIGSPQDDSIPDELLRLGACRSRRAQLLAQIGLWACSLAVVASAGLLARWVT